MKLNISPPNYLIVDMDPHARTSLGKQIKEIIPIATFLDAGNAAEAREAYLIYRFDGVFLNSSVLDGETMELVSELRLMGLPLVVTTTGERCTFDAFDADASDCIFLPTDPSRLTRALSRIRRVKSRQVQDCPSSSLVILSDQNHLWLIQQEDIILVESDGSCLVVHVKNRKPIFLSRSLKEIESMLPKEKFLRVNRSQIVQLKHLKTIKRRDTGSFSGELEDYGPFEFSRRQSQAFRLRFGI